MSPDKLKAYLTEDASNIFATLEDTYDCKYWFFSLIEKWPIEEQQSFICKHHAIDTMYFVKRWPLDVQKAFFASEVPIEVVAQWSHEDQIVYYEKYAPNYTAVIEKSLEMLKSRMREMMFEVHLVPAQNFHLVTGYSAKTDIDASLGFAAYNYFHGRKNPIYFPWVTAIMAIVEKQ